MSSGANDRRLSGHEAALSSALLASCISVLTVLPLYVCMDEKGLLDLCCFLLMFGRKKLTQMSSLVMSRHEAALSCAPLV